MCASNEETKSEVKLDLINEISKEKLTHLNEIWNIFF